jgi:hypothetical protein
MSFGGLLARADILYLYLAYMRIPVIVTESQVSLMPLETNGGREMPITPLVSVIHALSQL